MTSDKLISADINKLTVHVYIFFVLQHMEVVYINTIQKLQLFLSYMDTILQ